jgi:hypothetical protein
MTKIVTKYFKDNEIDKNITMVGKDAISLQQKIHNLAISTLLIWHNAGDDIKIKDSKKITIAKVSAMKIAVERINSLTNQSPYHAQAFTNWVSMFLPFDWSDENSGWFCHKDNAVLKGKQFIAARDNPFWTVSPPSKPKPVCTVDDIAKVIEKNQKRRKVSDDKRHIEDNLLTQLQERQILDILNGNMVEVEE